MSFNTSETNDKIDKLTSLVSKMKVKMYKCNTKSKPQIYQSKRRGQNRCNYTQMTTGQGTDHLVETETHYTEVGKLWSKV